MKPYIVFLFAAIGIKLLSAFCLQNLLGYGNLFLLLGVIGWTGYQMLHNHKSNLLKKGLILLCMLGVVVLPNHVLAMGKFYLLEPMYQHTVEGMAAELTEKEDAIFQEAQLEGLETLLLNSGEANAAYSKQGQLYTVSFTKHRNTFQWYAFVYFSEPEAVTLVTNPSQHWENISDEAAYDSITWLRDKQWALVKYY